jgi:ribosomal-protein-alanine N-acetyltransferase
MNTKDKNAEIYLDILSEKKCSENYVSWMNDSDITRFLESRWKYQSDESVKQYIQYMNDSPNNFLFGIFIKETEQHIGNIKIGSIDWVHRFGDVGLLIGERSFWGKGYATIAIEHVAEIAFTVLNLNKLWAGIYEGNEGSYKAFLKVGWNDAGLLKNHRYSGGKYVNEYLVEKCKD